MNPWFLLGVTIVAEVFSTSALKASEGFSRWPWAAVAMVGYALCFWLLSLVMRHIPMGVTYAIWSGVGMVLIAAIGGVIFGERLSPIQLGCIALILVGAAGLQLSTQTQAH